MTSSTRTEGPTVFVVDDDSGLRQGLARLLRSEGWNVETFDSAHGFLKRAPYGGTGCVLADVRMPEMSGPDLHSHMVARGMSLPVIFLTGHGDLRTGIEAMKMGAVDFLVKPVEDVALLQAVRRGLERHAAEQAARRARRGIENRLARLSTREREVLEHVVAGHTNLWIAEELDISLKTVKVHRARVMEKMEARSLAELVHLCDALQSASRVPWDQSPIVALDART